MANTNILRFDGKMQLRTDEAFRANLEALKTAMSTDDASEAIRRAVAFTKQHWREVKAPEKAPG